MTIDVLNTKGEKIGKMRLPKEIFGVEVSPQLLVQAVRVYLTNQRTARPKTKTRGEVRGSGRKIWRQKGTGRARHGDRYAPIFVGGGIAHGPKGVVKRLTMSKKMRKKALFGTLSEKVKKKRFLVVDGLDKIKPKTKNMVKTLENLAQQNTKPACQRLKAQPLAGRAAKQQRKTLLVLKTDQKKAIRAARNIADIQIAYFNQLNCYQVLRNNLVLFSKEALEHFNQLNK